MAEFVVYTWDRLDTSIRIIADDVAEYLSKLGHEVITTTKLDANLMNKRHVISTREHHSPDFAKMFRFVKPKSYVAIHTRNLEEFSEIEWAGFMAAFFKGEYAGSPFKGVSYSPYQYAQLRRWARMLFSASYAKTVVDNTVYVPFGIRDEFQWSESASRDMWVVPANRVTNTQKNIRLHSELSNKFNTVLMCRGQPSVAHVFKYAEGYGPEDTKSDIDLTPYILLPQPKTRQEYMGQIGSYGMALSTSLYESFGIYYLELLASGCVVVFLDRPWVRELLPNYKYVAKETDLVAMMLHVYGNYQEARSYLKTEVIPMIDEKYRLRRFVSELARISGA